MSEALTELFGSHLVDLQMLGNEPIIVDAGASTGAFIKDIREKVKNPKIYAIEPCKNNQLELVTFKRLTIFDAALVGKHRPETMTFYEKSGLPEWGNVNNLYPNRKGSQYEVFTITIDKILSVVDAGHIDYLKMDIEGSEEEVIYDLTPQTAKRISQISMELHGVSFVKMTDLLQSLGYQTTYKNGELYGRQKL